MISAVILFGLLNIVFEFVLLTMLSPRLRLRLLGSEGAKLLLHVLFLLANLIVHWGTLIGTMSSILAFVCSILTVRVAQMLYGKIEDGRHYTTGLIRYSREELT